MVRLQFEQRQEGADPADLYWLTISGYTGVILRIRSCNRVSMVLSEILGNTKVHTYEVRPMNSDSEAVMYQTVGVHLPLGYFIAHNDIFSFCVYNLIIAILFLTT